jgi:hypothetical protein
MLHEIEAVRMDAAPHYTTRVPDVSLDSSLLTALTGWSPTPLKEAFAQMLKEA